MMRPLPQSAETEKSVLASAMSSSRAIEDLMAGVVEDDFYLSVHKVIFRAIKKLFESGSTVNVVTVSNAIEGIPEADQQGGAAYLSEMLEVATVADVEPSLKILREKHLARDLIVASTEIAAAAYEEDANGVLDSAQARLGEIGAWSIRERMYSGGELCCQYAKDSDARVAGDITGISTGFTELDRLTCGFQRGDLVIVAGRPSMGKTAFAISIGINAAQQGRSVGIFSLEQSRQQVIERIICGTAKTSLVKLRSGMLSADERRAMSVAMGQIDSWSLWVNDEAALSVMQIRAHCRRLKRQCGLDLVIVDYLQLCVGEGSSREQEVSGISRACKLLAKDMDVPVIAVSQLSRKVEDGKDKEPQLWHLRDSGAIEQDADVVAMCYRPEYYGIKTANTRHSDGSISMRSFEGVGFIFVRKQRNGPVGDIELAWNKTSVIYEEGRSDDSEF